MMRQPNLRSIISPPPCLVSIRPRQVLIHRTANRGSIQPPELPTQIGSLPQQPTISIRGTINLIKVSKITKQQQRNLYLLTHLHHNPTRRRSLPHPKQHPLPLPLPTNPIQKPIKAPVCSPISRNGYAPKGSLGFYPPFDAQRKCLHPISAV